MVVKEESDSDHPDRAVRRLASNFEEVRHQRTQAAELLADANRLAQHPLEEQILDLLA
jgi:hypothetical protein